MSSDVVSCLILPNNIFFATLAAISVKKNLLMILFFEWERTNPKHRILIPLLCSPILNLEYCSIE